MIKKLYESRTPDGIIIKLDNEDLIFLGYIEMAKMNLKDRYRSELEKVEIPPYIQVEERDFPSLNLNKTGQIVNVGTIEEGKRYYFEVSDAEREYEISISAGELKALLYIDKAE